jgi:CubicO group peptidase (beta-lactamase class C family)
MRKSPAILTVLVAVVLVSLAQVGTTSASPASARPSTIPRTGHVSLRLGFEDLDAYVADAMLRWSVPGLALAIIEDGRIVASRGYGFRDLERRLPATPDTLFATGSLTKSFTATALAMLADEGKIEWDAPVNSYLPDFKLLDPIATEELTLRDLLTHRAGLPRHDLVWYGTNLSRQQLYERLRYLEPSGRPGEDFQYQNLTYLVAGLVAEKVSGLTWEELVAERIFAPLGMTRSSFSAASLQRASDSALPYGEGPEGPRLVAFRNLDAVGPASSIDSSAAEMARYLRLHLAAGRAGETRLLSTERARELRTPQVLMPAQDEYDETGPDSYGMGFVVGTYRGHELVHHCGSVDGFSSMLSFMPEEGAGVVVLTNLSGDNPVPTIITLDVYDRLLNVGRVDWIARGIRRASQLRGASPAEEEASRVEPVSEGRSTLHVADYAGIYEHPAYGTTIVSANGGMLEVEFHGIHLPLQHLHADTFEVAETHPLAGTAVTFYAGADGETERVAIAWEPQVDDIVFSASALGGKAARERLQPLVGEYAWGTATLRVSLVGESSLALSIDGGSAYELIPLGGLSYSIHGLSGYDVEFARDASGNVGELIVHQPSGDAVVKRLPESDR